MENVGLAAIYDSTILMSTSLEMLKQNLAKDLICYDLLKSVHAQGLKCHMTEYADKKHEPDTYSSGLYHTVATIKNTNAFLIFVFAAMKLAGVTDEEVFNLTENIAKKFGRLNQEDVFCYSYTYFNRFQIQLFVE